MVIEPEEERPPYEEEDEGGPVKSFLEHLEEFRWALIKSGAAVLVGVVLCLLAGNYVVGILMRPLQKARVSYPGTNQIVTVNFGTNRLGVFPLDPAQQAQFNLGTNRFVALDIVPMTIPVGTNQAQVLTVQVNTNQEVAERAQHMNTDLIVLSPD